MLLQEVHLAIFAKVRNNLTVDNIFGLGIL